MQANPSPIEQAFSLYNEGRLEEAEAKCLEGLSQNQQDVAGMRLLATIARETDRPAQAVEMLTFAVRLQPQNSYLAGEMAASLVLAGRADEAFPALEALVKDLPEHAISHYWLGRAYLAQFHGTRAARCFRTAYELDPHNDQILHMIGVGFLSAGRGREAEPWLREYAKKNPESSVAVFDLSVSLQQQVRLEEAAELYQRALRLDPDNAGAIAALGRYYRTYGRYAEARTLVRDAIDRLGPKPALAAVYAFLCDREGHAEEGIAEITRVIESQTVTPQSGIGLYFGLGRLQERAKNYEEAWAAFSKANNMFPSLYNAQLAETATTDLQNTFNAWTLSTMPKATVPTDKPVFVVGMPRSGTTLVEQILSSHPGCFGAGELLTLSQLAVELGRRLGGRWPVSVNAITPELANEFAERYLDHINALAPDAGRVVDKLPHNFKYLGLMSVLFPGARVIHCIRNPLDLCVSNYGTPLSPQHTWRPRLETLAHAYNEYRKIMEHWRSEATIPILDVVYEDTIGNVEAQARRLLDFVGLEWDERCLKFYEHSRAVATASTDQVRKPIYQSSKERWRRYENHLGPLIEGLKAGGTNIERPFDVERR